MKKRKPMTLMETRNLFYVVITNVCILELNSPNVRNTSALNSKSLSIGGLLTRRTPKHASKVRERASGGPGSFTVRAVAEERSPAGVIRVGDPSPEMSRSLSIRKLPHQTESVWPTTAEEALARRAALLCLSKPVRRSGPTRVASVEKASP